MSRFLHIKNLVRPFTKLSPVATQQTKFRSLLSDAQLFTAIYMIRCFSVLTVELNLTMKSDIEYARTESLMSLLKIPHIYQ